MSIANYFTIEYGTVAVCSLLLAVCYLLFEKKKDIKFILLYTCVAVVNGGYYLQAVSNAVSSAMMANRMSYLGAAYLMLLMLLIVLDVCGIRLSKGVRYLLIGISTCAFLLAASGDWLGLYYSRVWIETVGSSTKLMKEYGPLHYLYALYLVGYMLLMVAVIVYAARKKKIPSVRHAVFLASVVLWNLIVWAFGQAVDTDFEFLSVSYMITEVLLLLLYGMLKDYGIIREGQFACLPISVEQSDASQPIKELPPNMEEMFDAFVEKVSSLSSAEHRILNYYIHGHEIAQIPDLAFISIHTVKKHNRSIYQKLEISSRDELMLYIELFRRCGRLDELLRESVEAQ